MSKFADRETYLTLAQLAVVFNLTGPTVQTWAREGRGPSFVSAGKCASGRRIRFRLDDVERFIEERVVRPEAGKITANGEAAASAANNARAASVTYQQG